VADNPAGRLACVIPALEGGDDRGRVELSDAVELYLGPPPDFLVLQVTCMTVFTA
jgi:hypothetical protein